MSKIESFREGQYGIYIPSIKTFMCFENNREEFKKMMRFLEGDSAEQVKEFGEGELNDFDYIIEEVRNAPFSVTSLELIQYDIWLH